MLNEKKNNSLSIKNSTEISRKDAVASTESGSVLDDGQASTRSTYESFSWLFAYTQMFTRRLFKDLLISIIGYLYSGQIVPNHIVNLVSVQKSLRAERDSQTVTYTRYNLMKNKCIVQTIKRSKKNNSLVSEKTRPATYRTTYHP